MGFVAVVDPRTERRLDDFAANTDLATVVDGEDSPFREACASSNYELVVVDPAGALTDLPRSWTLPDQTAELTAAIEALLAAADQPAGGDGGTTPPTDVAAPLPDAGAIPDADGPADIPSVPDLPPSDASVDPDVPIVFDLPLPMDLPQPPRDTPTPPDVPSRDIPPPPDVAATDGPNDVSFEVTARALELFAAEDRNPRSPWYGQVIGPGDLTGTVYLLFFANGG